MNKNQDRIWDTLIEDAMRESGVSQPPQPVGDSTRRLLTPVGAPGVDRGRSLRGPSRRKWAPLGISIALLVMVAAILYAGIVYLPQLADSREPTDQPKQAEGTPSPPRKQRDNTPAIPNPERQPQPEDSGPVKQSEDSGPIDPEPDVTPEEPKHKPDDTVEQPTPEPKPDDTVEQPKPEPQPDDTVEQPKQREGTEPAPAKPLLTVSLLSVPARADLELSVDREKWARPEGNSFEANVWLKCRKPVNVVVGGVLLRFDGEVRVFCNDDTLELELFDDRLFIDNRGAAREAAIRADGYDLSLGSGAVLLDRNAANTFICVYEGVLACGDTEIPEHRCAHLTPRGLSDQSPMKTPMNEVAFLKDLAVRVAYREDFDTEKPEGRLREGEIRDGVLAGPTVFWGYPDNLQHEAGAVLRLRVRFSRATGASVTQFAMPRNDNFSLELKAEQIKDGEWQVLELKVDEFLERTTHKEHPNEVDWFQNISIQLEGENAQVELDWVELIRAVK